MGEDGYEDRIQKQHKKRTRTIIRRINSTKTRTRTIVRENKQRKNKDKDDHKSE
jgi:hypothetical protein